MLGNGHFLEQGFPRISAQGRSKTRLQMAKPDDAWAHPADMRDERPSETAGGDPTDGT